MNEILNLEPIPDEELRDTRGVLFPASMRFRQLLVTGPPGCGKTRLISKVGGWPEEGYIDLLLKNWWRAQALTLRPRGVHLGMPFVGYEKALTVFDKEWLEAPSPPRLDPSRIILPPEKTHFLAVDWRQKFVFDFLLPPPDEILKWRLDRSTREAHPVDEGVTLEQVERQIDVYCEVALHLHRSGMLIYVRDQFDGVPKNILDGGHVVCGSAELDHVET